MKDGLLLMLVGMGTVFMFLSLMIVVMKGATVVLGKFTHLLPDDVIETKPRAATAQRSDQDIAVVLAAIEQHRR